MYLPFCGIAISNAQLFAASRKEYDRSRVRAKGQPAGPPSPSSYNQHYYIPSNVDIRLCIDQPQPYCVPPFAAAAVRDHGAALHVQFLFGDGLAQHLVYDLNLRGTVKR